MEESVFIDDNEKNIEVAKSLEFMGILIKKYTKLEIGLKNLGADF